MVRTKPGKIKFALLVSLALFLSICGATTHTPRAFANYLPGTLQTSPISSVPFDFVSMNIDGTGEDLKIAVIFVREDFPSSATRRKEDQYLESIDIDGSVLDDPQYRANRYSVRSISFTVKDTDELNEDLNKIFLTSDSEMKIKPMQPGDRDLQLQVMYSGKIDTSKIARKSEGYISTTDRNVNPTQRNFNNFTAIGTKPATVEKFDTNLEVLDSKTTKLTLSFDMPIDEAKILDSQIENLFTPDRKIGTLDYTDNDETRHFVIDIPEINDENIDDVENFIEGSISMEDAYQNDPGDYYVGFTFDADRFLRNSANEYTAKISLPSHDTFAGESIPEYIDEHWDFEDGVATFDGDLANIDIYLGVNEFPLVLVIALISIGVVLIILLLLILIFRKKILAFFAHRKEKAAQKAAAQQAAMAQAAAYQQQQQQQLMQQQQQQMQQQPQPVVNRQPVMPQQQPATQQMPPQMQPQQQPVMPQQQPATQEMPPQMQPQQQPVMPPQQQMQQPNNSDDNFDLI